MQTSLSEAFSTKASGLKVVVAEGECQLERQRRLQPYVARRLTAGERTVRVRYGIDEDLCTGDHACIRLSGCPSLTLKEAADPLRVDPVSTIDAGCVGCGLCGEVAQAAALCPSFYRVEVITHASAWERFSAQLRSWVTRALLPV
jgi:indolepyruvate ferredoxin oxidoreductase alpha subunit